MTLSKTLIPNSIELRQVAYSFPHRKGANTRESGLFSNISLQINGTEGTGLSGENGSGKSTLLRIVATLLRPTAGVLLFDGTDSTQHLSAIRLRTNYSAGAPLGFYPRLSGTDNLCLFSALKGSMISPREAQTLMERAALPRSAYDKKYHEFSLGMRQRLHIARLLLKPCDFILLDEPTNGLAPDGVDTLIDILNKDLAHTTRFIVCHDKKFLAKVTHRQFTLQHQRVIQNETDV